MKKNVKFNDCEKPLVSILLQSSNNDKYLKGCLDSIINQTYRNIEVFVSDVNSSNFFWDMVVEYQEKYPGIFTLLKYSSSDFDYINCPMPPGIKGKYVVRIIPSTFLHPDYVEKCVWVFEEHSEIAFVKTRKILVLDEGEVEERPLYRQSCIVPGTKYLVDKWQSISLVETPVMCAASPLKYIQNNDPFSIEVKLCCSYNMAYLNRPLIKVREQQPSYITIAPFYLKRLLDMFGYAMNLVKSLWYYWKIEIIDPEKMRDIFVGRCLELAVYYIKKNCSDDAKKCFHQAQVWSSDLEEVPLFTELCEYWQADTEQQARLSASWKLSDNFLISSKTFAIPSKSKLLRDADKGQ
ncbi:MAG: glycosyltransferase family 2 protein [Candidatus Heimdallarchaeota archaeon]|nr:glycosyltransferase family 2 protein [Candidatus Heimdallarchaeota archaeon]